MDLSLDDLIKKDKQENKKKFQEKKAKQGNPAPNAANPNPKKFAGKQKFKEQQDNRPQRQENDNRPPKQKFIKKQFENNRPPRREQREEKPQKFTKPREEKANNPDDNKEKLFRTLKVLGLSPEFTNEDLYKLFAAEGALEKCLIEQDNFGRSLTTAIVKYHSPESARSAIQNLNRHKIMNCILTVEPYKNVKPN